MSKTSRPALRQARGKVDRRGGLAHAALLISYGYYFHEGLICRLRHHDRTRQAWN